MAVMPTKSPIRSPGARARPGTMVLNSWKEIAAYLKCGVRTVQRWERDLDLPVYRPRPGKRGPVCAFPGELQIWMRQRKTEHPSLAHPVRNGGALDTSNRLIHMSAELVKQAAAATRAQQEKAVRLLDTVEKLRRQLEGRRRWQTNHKTQ